MMLKLLTLSLAAAAFVTPAAAFEFEPPQIVGLHMGTIHSNIGFCSNTPGGYAKWKNGFTIGAYKNSECEKYSAYAGWTWQTEGSVRASVTVGAVTGYRYASVMPLVAPSLTFDITKEVAMRLTYLPKVTSDGAHALNFAIEKSF